MASADNQMVLTNQRMALNLLTAMKPKFNAGLLGEGTSTFCRAYALEPSLCIRHLVAMPKQIVQRVVSTLEDWCANTGHVISDGVFQHRMIPLTWEQVCDVILSPELAPHSYPAWCVKVKYQMQEKRYELLVTTCTEALKIFADGQVERSAFWIPRGLAYLVLQESEKAVNDYLSAFEENPLACQVFVAKQQSDHVGSILNAFYHALEELDTETASEPEDVSMSTKFLQVIVAFEEEPSACAVCAGRMMKERNFNEAIKVLSLAIQRLTESSATTDYLQLLFMRAECHMELNETDKALEDYVATRSLEEELTRVTLRALPLHQQSTLVARAAHVASDNLVRCQQDSTSKVSSSVDRRWIQKQLTIAAALFKLLNLIDEENVDALYSAAECHKLLGSFIEAIQLFTRFLSLRPESGDAHCDRAACHFECGDMRSALSDYDTSLILQPTFVQGLCGRAWLWLRRGEPGNAVTDFAAASRVSAALSACWIQTLAEEEQVDMRAKLKDHLARTVEAETGGKSGEDVLVVADLLLRTWPSDVTCHLLYADILVALKKMDEAQASLVKLLELLENDPGQLAATVHLAALRMKQGKVASAMEDLVTAARTHGEGKLKAALLNLKEDQRRRISREAHDRGVKRAECINPDDPTSDMLFTVAVSATMCHAHAWNSYFWRAKVRWRFHNPREALADCSTALSLKADSVELRCWRALILLHCKKLKAAYTDLIRALLLDDEVLERFIASRPEGEKKRLMEALEDCVQRLFRLYKKAEDTLSIILVMSQLLVKLDGTSYIYHSDFADALICAKDLQRAAEELSEAERISPDNVSALSRGSHMQMLLGNVNMCVLKLCSIAKLKPEALDVSLGLFSKAQRKSIAINSFARAGGCDDDRAVVYYTVCIAASLTKAEEALRMRSQCLGRLRCYTPAIEDISAVISEGPARIGDLCARANLYNLNQKPKAACSDYIAALELDAGIAREIISHCPATRDGVCQEFLSAAMEEVQRKNVPGALKLCSYGLLINPDNSELKQIKAQLEKSKTKKCLIQ